MAKLKIELNDLNSVQSLLQETYVLADEQLKQAQDEINKLANSTRLQDETMDSKSRYSKAMNDYMGIKDKAISKKIEIAKLMSEILKSNDSQGAGIDASHMGKQSFDLSKIKEMVKNMHNESKEQTKTIELNKK